MTSEMAEMNTAVLTDTANGDMNNHVSTDAVPLESCDNYRRFSSRVRHKTDFYVPREGTDDKEIVGGRGGRKRKSVVGVPPGVRQLISEVPKTPQVAAAPDVMVEEECQVDMVIDKDSSNVQEDGHIRVDKTNKGPSQIALAAVQCDLTPPPSAASNVSTSSDEDSSTVPEVYPIGSIVWGKLPGYDWWPGSIIRDKEGDSVEEVGAGGGGLQVWVKWYGENNLSQIPTDKVVLFSNFTEYFNASSLKGIYKRGIFMAIKEAARRCKCEFQSRQQEEGAVDLDRKEENARLGGSRSRKRSKRAGRRERGSIQLSSLEEEMLKWAMNGFPPAGPLGLVPTSEQDVVQSGGSRREEGKERGGDSGGEDKEPPKKKAKGKKASFDSVSEGKVKISDICLACGALDIQTGHPLFEGGLCKQCMDIFLECAYLFDDDGTQKYCCICSDGDNVFICDAENCAKVYCPNCVSKLCGPQELERVNATSQWLCYMCCPEFHSVGLLTRRHDWDRKLQELFLSDHEMECAPPPISPPISPESRMPVRVLELYTESALSALAELGIEVDSYTTTEANASQVVPHQVFHIGDISRITNKEIQTLGPFDLVIGGNPCNDLSITSPARNECVRLFFEFFRILRSVRHCGKGDSERPLFWLYENAVSMRAQDKHTISSFLQCNPVVVDAKDILATHRARYFWGNIPGMNRAVSLLPKESPTLQPNSRFAQFKKLTTKMNSINQTKAAIYPVRMAPLVDGMEQSDLPKEGVQGDVLWCTEMERLFVFSQLCDNTECSDGQQLLGKAWSVPVLRSLLSPLKDYFRSNTSM